MRVEVVQKFMGVRMAAIAHCGLRRAVRSFHLRTCSSSIPSRPGSAALIVLAVRFRMAFSTHHLHRGASAAFASAIRVTGRPSVRSASAAAAMDFPTKSSIRGFERLREGPHDGFAIPPPVPLPPAQRLHERKMLVSDFPQEVLQRLPHVLHPDCAHVELKPWPPLPPLACEAIPTPWTARSCRSVVVPNPAA